MNEETEKQLLEWAQQAIAYGQAQVPLLVEQYIQWAIVAHCMGLVLAILIGGAVLYWWRYATKRMADDYEEDWMIGRLLISLTGVSVALVIFIHNLYFLLKVWFAPAIYVIDSLTK